MSGKTYRPKLRQRLRRGENGFIFVAATCLGLMVTNMDAFASTANPGSNWSFAVISDPQGGGTNTPDYPCVNTPVDRAMCEAIINDGVSFVIVSGDLQHGKEGGYDGYTIDEQLAFWTNNVSALGRAGIPYYAVRGNHENYPKGSELPHEDWTKHIGQHMPQNGPEQEKGMTYSFPTNNALFIGLDTFDGTQDTAHYYMINQEWLDGQLSNNLAANTRPHLFVFGHEPAFQAGIWCMSEKKPERNNFWNSIANANARTYFCGHSHVYGRCLASISNGPALRQIIVGTGGGSLDPWSDYTNYPDSAASIVAETHHTHHWGYMLVRVSGNHVDMAYKRTTNSLTTWATNDVVEWTTNDTFSYTIASTPTNVSVSRTYVDRVLVSWDAAAASSGYEVWRGTNASVATSRALIGVATNTSFSDTSAVSNRHYYYWVRATNDAGASLFSAPGSGFLGVVGPLITVNGMVGDVSLNSGDTVTIAVHMMNIEPYVGTEIDWWVVALAGSSWYYLNNSVQWTQEDNWHNWHPVNQGPLFNLPATEVLNTTDLSTGSYTFWFAVDYPMEGILNVDGPILLDSVKVNVQ